MRWRMRLGVDCQQNIGWANRSRCFRELRLICSGGLRPSLEFMRRSQSAATEEKSLRAFFKGSRFTAEKREHFPGEMQGTGDQYRIWFRPRDCERLSKRWSDGAME